MSYRTRTTGDPAEISQSPDDAILDAVAHLIVVVDAHGRITRFNRPCEQATGRPRAEVVGCRFDEIFSPVRAADDLPEPQPPGAVETRHVAPGGTTRAIAWTRAPLPAGGAVYTGIDVAGRQAAEHTLRDREQLYRNIVETAHEGIWVIDTEGRTLYANPRIAEILGYTPAEMLAVNVYDCMDAADHIGFRERLERRKGGETQTLEWPCRRRDGSPCWTMVTSSPLFDDAGRLFGVLGMVTDLSEQKRVADVLHETEERFRLAVEASPDVMFFQDADLRITWVSKTVSPRTPQDYLGMTDADLLSPAEAARLAVVKRRVLATGVTERTEVEYEVCGRRMSIDVVLVRRTDGRGRVLGLAGYVRDVTERKELERSLATINLDLERRVAERTESLRFSEERFRLMVDQAPVSIQILSHDGRTLRVNEAFRRLFGVGTEELANYNILADPQLEASGVLPLIRRAFAGETVVVPPVPYVPDRGPLTGDERWAQALIYPVKGDGGEVREVVIVHEDVTERHRAEALLRESERHHRELAERNRLLVQEVEHRVGNNLAGLMGLVAMMRNRGVRDVDAFAESIGARLRAMTRVHRMLVGSNWQPLGLRELVATVLGGMGQMAPCAAAEHVDGPDLAIPPRLALPLMLILAEWHTNSCKHGAHSRPGGEVRIHWQVTLPDDRVRLTWRERGGPPIDGPVVPSVGTELITGFVTRELAGTCTLTYPPAGADHTIEFPLTPRKSPANDP